MRRRDAVFGLVVTFVACSSPSEEGATSARGRDASVPVDAATGGVAGSATGGSGAGGGAVTLDAGNARGSPEASVGAGGVVDSGQGPCRTDADCPAEQWCNYPATPAVCAPYVGAGEECSVAGAITVAKCAPDLACQDRLSTGSTAYRGVCGVVCEVNEDCAAGQYCSLPSGVCRDMGDCRDSYDCNAFGNTYAHDGCEGYGICSIAARGCEWRCGDVGCVDIDEWRLPTGGPCDRVEGWAVYQGACASLTLCDARGLTVYESEAACRGACGGGDGGVDGG